MRSKKELGAPSAYVCWAEGCKRKAALNLPRSPVVKKSFYKVIESDGMRSEVTANTVDLGHSSAHLSTFKSRLSPLPG